MNNVVAYDDDGALVTTTVLQGGPDMAELRALNLVSDTVLWVLSGGAGSSEILAFERSGSGNDAFKYTGKPVAQYAKGSALLHPFDFVFDPQGNCYVSNQDTDVVARLDVDPSFLSATPAPPPKSLQGRGTFWPGTFVASVDPNLPRGDSGGPSSSTVPAPAGLEDWPPCQGVGPCPKLINSVRGLAWTNQALYVADEVAAVVKIYDGDGALLGVSNPVGTPAAGATGPSDGPVHLLVAGGNGNPTLLVTNGKDVYSGELDPTHPDSLDLQPIGGIKVPKVAGVAVAPGGILYAASRTQDTLDADGKKQALIFQYTNFPEDPTLESSFLVDVDDVPEFVLHVPDAP